MMKLFFYTFLIASAFGFISTKDNSGFLPYSNINFNEGNYKILGYLEEPDAISMNPENSFKSFLIDDSNTLKEIRNDWKFDSLNRSPYIGQDINDIYTILLFKNKESVSQYKIFLGDRAITSEDNFNYYFDLNKMRKITGRGKDPLVSKSYVEFKTVDEGRKYLKTLLNNNQVIGYERPLWLDYKGSFNISCYDTKNDAVVELEKIRNIISKKNPKDVFKIVYRFDQPWGETDSVKYDFNISSNKSLYDNLKFDQLYSKETWEENPLTVNVYKKR